MQKSFYILIVLSSLLIFTPFCSLQVFHNMQLISPKENITQSTTSLLIIYNTPDDNKTAQQLLTYRPDISLKNVTFINWQNDFYLFNITNNGSYLLFNEFWIIINNINFSSPHTGFALLLIKLSVINTIRVLFLSSDIYILTTYLSNSTLLSYFQINSCFPSENTGLSNITVTYPLAQNLSALLNITVPKSEGFSGNMTYSNCTLNSNAYIVTQVSTIGNSTLKTPISLVYLPSFKAHLVVGLFSFYYSINQSKLLQMNFFNTNNNFIIPKSPISPSLSSYLNIQQNSTVNLFLILALLVSGQYYFQTSSNSSTYPTSSIFNPSSPITNPSSNILNINLFGFSLPQFPEWVYPTIIVTGVLGLVLLVLRKFWFIIAGILVFIGTLIYHPDRKLDAMEVLNHTKRQKIMDLLNIQAEQGETFRNLSEKLKVPVPTLLWHLKILEDFSFIQMFKIRRETVIVSQDYVKKFDPIIKEFELSFKSSQAQLFKAFLINLKPNQTFTIKDVIYCTKWNIRTAKRHLNHLNSLKILDISKGTKNFFVNPKYCTKIQLFNEKVTNSKYIKNH